MAAQGESDWNADADGGAGYRLNRFIDVTGRDKDHDEA
jgi:hypothetical protein